MSKKHYNGHESWNAWNVSLWISNDEGTYRRAVEIRRSSRTIERAAERLLEELPEKTPDGAPYSKHTVKLALRDL